MERARAENVTGGLSATDKLEIVSRVALEWSAYLSPSELVLVHWLVANTIIRGNRAGTYSLNQIIRGVPRRGGEGYWCLGCGMSKSTVQRAISGLRSRGVLLTSSGSNGDATRFAVNLSWHPARGQSSCSEGDGDDGATVLRLPKKGVSEPSSGLKGMVKLTTGYGQSDHPSIGRQLQEVDTTSPPAARTVAEVVKSVEENRKKKKPTNNATGYQQTWNEAWREGSFRRVAPAFTTKTGGMLAKALKRDWPARFGDQHEMIRWTVLNWNAAVSGKLAWMTKNPPPVTPDPNFLAHFIKYFIDAFMDAETVRWINTLPRTQQQIEELVHQGLDREVAIFEVAKTQVLAAERENIGRKQREAHNTLELAKMMIARAERATRFTADNPHPQAESKVVHLSLKGDGDGSFDVPPLPEMNFDE